MLRCVDCGGLAHAGLAHIHGDPTRPRCESCTKRAIDAPKAPEAPEIAAEDLEEVLQRVSAELLEAA
jgi:hypothetical protein